MGTEKQEQILAQIEELTEDVIREFEPQQWGMTLLGHLEAKTTVMVDGRPAHVDGYDEALQRVQSYVRDALGRRCYDDPQDMVHFLANRLIERWSTDPDTLRDDILFAIDHTLDACCERSALRDTPSETEQ